MKRLTSNLVLSLFICSLLFAIPKIQIVKTQPPYDTATIRADGTIDPDTAPIQCDGDVYTLVGDFNGFVVLARNNTVLDGAGHAVQGIIGPPVEQVGYQWQVNSTVNLTIANAVINGGWIAFASLSNSIVVNNTLNGGRGIGWHGEGNIISGNNIIDTNYPSSSGIAIGGSKNTVFGNYIAGTNGTAIHVGTSFNNTIVGNQIEDNKVGIYTLNIYSQGGAHDNIIYYNNFINNTKNVDNDVIMASVAVNNWDNSSMGNYWSDYNNKDYDGDGIGDTPYVIDENNQDNYPLMKPVNISAIIIPEFPDTTSPIISIISPKNKTYAVNNVSLAFTVNELSSWIGYSLDGQANVTIAGNTTLTGLFDGTHSLIVYAKDTAGNTGASETIYFTIAQQSEPFPTIWIVATTVIVAIAVIGAALLVYFRKIRKTTVKTEKQFIRK